MQRNLGGLAHRADEQTDTDRGDQRPAGFRDGHRREGGRLGEHFRIVEGARKRSNQTDAEQEAEVTHAIDEKSLHVCEDRRRTGVPETDQQIRDEAHRFPTEEQLEEVVGHHEHQHRERKQRDVAEEALVTRIFRHVPDGVEVHHQGHEGHDEHHHDRQVVDQETDFKGDPAAGSPGVQGSVEGVPRLDILEYEHRPDKSYRDTEYGHDVRASAANDLSEQASHDRAKKRR